MKLRGNILFFLLIAGFAHSQTIVSTTPQNRNAVFEEYGGYKCEYCPDGHGIINLIKQYYQEHFIPINIQVSDYAIPNEGVLDLRSDYGEGYLTQTGLIGYPAATINRHVFPGLEQGSNGTTAVNRNNWNNAVGQIVDFSSPVNVGAVAELDLESGQLNVDVELYYTANSAFTKNYLHIAILQDSIISPQLDDGVWDTEYVHRHVLRDMITGQWGDEINTTTEGHFEAFNYTYDLPAYYRNIIVDPSKISLVVYVSEDEQEILNGVAVQPEVMLSTLDAHVTNVSSGNEICGSYIAPSFTLRNDGVQHIQQMEIMYSINGNNPSYYTWTGDLCTFDHQLVQLPEVEFTPNYLGDDNWIDIQVLEVNEGIDNVEWNNSNSAMFTTAPITNSIFLEVQILTDFYGYETYWEIVDDNEEIIAFGGNQNVGLNGGGQQSAFPFDPGAYGSNEFASQEIQLDEDACYEFRIYDDYGDGMCCNYGSGYFRLIDDAGVILLEGGDFEVKDLHTFEKGDYAVSTTEVPINEENLNVRVFPNPSPKGGLINLDLNIIGTNPKLSVYNATGQLIFEEDVNTMTSTKELSTINWASGTYFVHLASSEGTKVQKFVIQ